MIFQGTAYFIHPRNQYNPKENVDQRKRSYIHTHTCDNRTQFFLVDWAFKNALAIDIFLLFRYPLEIDSSILTPEVAVGRRS